MGTSRIHRKSWDKDWDVHCLTFSTFRRQPFFRGQPGAVVCGANLGAVACGAQRSNHAVAWFLDTLADARQKCPFHLFAYVVMPEHVHLVLQPLPGVAMRRILWHLKRPVTAKALTWVKAHSPEFLARMTDAQPSGRITHRFWQRGGGYDRNLRSASDMHEKIGYVHGNPVRRGLVVRAEDWPHSSAAEWILQKRVVVPLSCANHGTRCVPIDWDYLPDPELR